MLLRRLYDDGSLARFREAREQALAAGASADEAERAARAAAPPRVVGVQVLRANRRQRFAVGLVEEGAAQGWLRIERGRIVLLAANGRWTYRVERTPGYYCCHCGEALPDSERAKEHVALHTANRAAPSWWRRLWGEPAAAVPDPQNPSGYRRDLFYDCVLEERP